MLQTYRWQVESRLDALLPPSDEPPANLHAAMRYAVLGGGKRLRPLLAMASALAVGSPADSGLDVGCAAELVHCFSLIHDDLPAIDDDDLRRSRPTVHKKFNEAIAVLAGDALFALAFATLGHAGDPDRIARCLSSLSQATGGRGLVGGEVMDVEAEGGPVDIALLETIHSRKTGALISSSCEMGGIAGGGDEMECRTLALFGRELGLAFQIVDDILNETSSSEVLGKAAGTDRDKGKLTYPAAVGLEASKSEAEKALDRALGHLCQLEGETTVLEEIARACVVRDS